MSKLINDMFAQIICAVCLCWLAAMSMPAGAQPVKLEQGLHYQLLATPLPDTDAERINITELFWYGCPACYDLLPTLQIWEASYRTTDITFNRLPVAWNPVMQKHARIYLTADALGLVPPANKDSWDVTRTAHNAVFDAIQRDNLPLLSEEQVQQVFAALGVAAEDFAAAWNSDAVSAKMTELQALPGQQAIARLPALLVDGRYVISYNAAVKNSDDLFKVLSQLVVDIRETRRRAAQ